MSDKEIYKLEQKLATKFEDGFVERNESIKSCFKNQVLKLLKNYFDLGVKKDIIEYNNFNQFVNEITFSPIRGNKTIVIDKSIYKKIEGSVDLNFGRRDITTLAGYKLITEEGDSQNKGVVLDYLNYKYFKESLPDNINFWEVVNYG